MASPIEDPLSKVRTLEGRVQDLERELATFAQSVSHDLRAPVRHVRAFTELLVDDHGDDLDEDARAYAEIIRDSARKLDGMIEQLVLYSRLGRKKHKLERIELAEAVRAALWEIEPARLPTTDWAHLDEPLGAAWADMTVTVEAIQRLLENALTFVEPATTPEVQITSEHRGARIRLRIEDNGIGIDPEQAHRAFDPFERLGASDERPGYGMGLALVRRAVHRMGGAVGVEAREGGGSCFWVELPVEPGAQ